MREIVKTTEEATLLGMNFIQTLANLEELEKQIKKKDQKYEQAEAEWRQGTLGMALYASHRLYCSY